MTALLHCLYTLGFGKVSDLQSFRLNFCARAIAVLPRTLGA